MKKFCTNLKLKRFLAPMVFLIFLFVLLGNTNAQTATENSIKQSGKTVGIGSLNPSAIIGNEVAIINSSGKMSNCTVTYSWESASDENFTVNVKRNLATTKDYVPGVITTTTYYRRIVNANCNDIRFESSSTTPCIKFTVK